jgi:hypothetical protein
VIPLVLAILGGKMLGLKDPMDLDTYNYKVCEVLYCEEEATELYEDDRHVVDTCMSHYKELDNTRYSY